MSKSVFANQTTPYAGGKKAPIGSLEDAALQETLKTYRLAVAKRYRVVDADKIEQAIPAGKAWIATKLDGELWFLVKRKGEVALCSYNGRVLLGTSLVAEATKALASSGDAVFAGELVAIPPEGRPRVHHVGAALSDEKQEDRLTFQAFDVVESDGENGQSWAYGKRLELLRKLFEKGKRVVLINTVEGDAKDALSYYREWVGAQRFEGIVVRSEVGITYKIKPSFTIDAVIIAYGARVQEGVPTLRELSVALVRDDGRLQLLGSVGGGFSEEDRVRWHERLAKIEVPSAFRMANRDGALCRFVKPEIVVEIQCSDLIEVDADDVQVARMTLAYDKTTGYKPMGDAPIAAMLFPVFLRERTDKLVDVASIGMTQVTSRLALDPSAGSGGAPLAKSTIVRRGVWVKGPTAVRKLLVIETHKSQRQGFAPFLVYSTDFSAGRAKPLDTAVQTAATLERANELAEVWITENVKRGWVAAGEGAPEAPPAAPAAKKPAKKTAAAAATATEGAEAAPTDEAPAAKKPAVKRASKKAAPKDEAE